MALFARRPWAWCAIGGLLPSPALAGVLSLHLAFEHQHGAENDERVATFGAVLHGHAHDDGTPEHDHVVTQVSMPKSAPGTRAPAASPVAMLPGVATQGRGRPTERVEIGPPPRAGPAPVLQAVLRL